jgi:hypothetical protein
MSIVRAINVNHFEAMEKRGWDKTYWFFDLHSTVIRPNYKVGNIPREFYPHAKEVLQMLTKLDDVCMSIYTCSHPHEIEEYLKYFEENDIVFDYINGNPEVQSKEGGYGYYKDKPYMNVLFEDKAGFDADTEWEDVRNLLTEKYGEITK